MNRLARTIVAAACVLAVSTPAQAEGPGWIINATITKLVVTADGGINVRLSPDLTACVSNSGYGPGYASLYPSHPGINRIHALLVTAFVNRTQMSFYLSDSTCRIGEVMLGTY